MRRYRAMSLRAGVLAAGCAVVVGVLLSAAPLHLFTCSWPAPQAQWRLSNALQLTGLSANAVLPSQEYSELVGEPERKYHIFVRGGSTHGIGPQFCEAARLAAANVGDDQVILFLNDHTPECNGVGTQYVGVDCNPAAILAIMHGVRYNHSKRSIDTDSVGGFSVALTVFSHGNPGSMDPDDPMKAAMDNQRWLMAEFHEPPSEGPGTEFLRNSPAAREDKAEGMGGWSVFMGAIHWEEMMEATRFLVDEKGCRGVLFNFKFCYSGGFLRWLEDPAYDGQIAHWPVFGMSSSDAYTYSFGDSISPHFVYRQLLQMLALSNSTTNGGDARPYPAMADVFSALKRDFLEERSRGIDLLGPTQQREARDPAITDPSGYTPVGAGTRQGLALPLSTFFE